MPNRMELVARQRKPMDQAALGDGIGRETRESNAADEQSNLSYLGKIAGGLGALWEGSTVAGKRR